MGLAMDEYQEGPRSTWRDEAAIVGQLGRHQLEKLERGKNRSKLHWRAPEVTVTFLLERLVDEVEELAAVTQEPWSPTLVHDIWEEAADVANLAAMIADACTTPEDL